MRFPMRDSRGKNCHESVKALARARDTLDPMEQPATTAESSSFVSWLATLTRPGGRTEAAGNEDGLADDVALLSYESALLRPTRSHESGLGSAYGGHPVPGRAEALAGALPTFEARIKEGSPETRTGVAKHARFTVRLSGPELEQLRARAAESGLTVSAYLRTCILEVESLRSQVKEALARMRAPQTREEPHAAKGPAKPGPQPANRWRERLLPRWKNGEKRECA